jgi:hypothetical protein
MIKTILTLSLIAYSLLVIGQTKIEKTFPVQGIQKIELAFDYPELIQVHTWDKREVLVKGSVSINRGEHDSAFQLLSSSKNNTLQITSEIKDKNNIPRRTIIKRGDQEYFFKAADASDPAVQKFLEENGRDYTYMTNGLIQEITLEIFVPKGMECRIDAKYGLVEITDFNAPLVVNAPYGGIDATIANSTTGQLTARTKFGEILTNLDTKFQSADMNNNHHDHWTEINTNFGNGPRFDFESKFGKVYLRKPK